jgi:hypothetical protein
MDESLLSVVMAPFGVLLAFAIFLALTLVVLLLRARSARRKRRLRRAREAHAAASAPAASMQTEAEAPLPPLRTYHMPVIDVSEERVFEALEEIAARSIMGHRVLPQVALSAFLYTGSHGMSRVQEQSAAALMASRQVDFLLVDGDWRPVIAVNIARDNLSDEADDDFEARACITAGVGFLVVQASGPTPAQVDEIRRLVEVGQPVAAQ